MLFFVLLLFPLTESAWLTQQETVALNYKCESGCWFNETEINSTTIVHWPLNCSTVCGVISFQSNADIPIFDLQSYFKNLKLLKGGLYMYNSEYISTSFLSNLEEIQCDALGIEFAFNAALRDLPFDSLRTINCPFYAYNNSQLDATSFCEKFEEVVDMFVYSNQKNCRGCVSGTFNYDTFRNYASCTALVGPTSITDTYIAAGTDMSPLSSIVNINGSFEVYRTDITDLSFLKSLVFIKSNHYWANDMDVHENYEMTRLNLTSLQSLKVTKGVFTFNLEKVHPDFCLTTGEMELFMRNDVQFNKIEALYCRNDTGDGVCEFERMSSLEENCVGVLGKIVVDSGDEPYVAKLKSVKVVYGSMIIQNTNLSDLSFLQSLEYIALLNDTNTGFQIVSNKNLQNVGMPKLKRVYSKSKYQISFNENGPNLLNSSACLQLMEGLVTTNVVFDRQECEVIDRTNGTLDNNCKPTVFISGTALLIFPILLFCC